MHERLSSDQGEFSDYSQKENEILLKVGLNAIFVPELTASDNFGQLTPLSPEHALHRFQVFLDQIDSKRGEVVGIIQLVLYKLKLIWGQSRELLGRL
jgi:hypothetical protein